MPGPIELASQEFIQQDIINIKTLLYALRGVLVVSLELTADCFLSDVLEVSSFRTALRVVMRLRILTV